MGSATQQYHFSQEQIEMKNLFLRGALLTMTAGFLAIGNEYRSQTEASEENVAAFRKK